MNENCNYALRPEELELRRALMRPALKWVCKLCQEQAASGRYYILENPLRDLITHIRQLSAQKASVERAAPVELAESSGTSTLPEREPVMNCCLY